MRTSRLIALVLICGCRADRTSKEPEATVEKAAHDVGDAVEHAADRAREVGRDASESLGRTVDDALGTPREAAPDEDAPEDEEPDESASTG